MFEREWVLLALDVSDENFELLMESGVLPEPEIDKRGDFVWPLDWCERRMDKVPNVYFMWDGERIKIGFSCNVDRRKDELEAQYQRRMSIIHAIRGNRIVEAFLHRRFDRFSLGDEWFVPAPE